MSATRTTRAVTAIATVCSALMVALAVGALTDPAAAPKLLAALYIDLAVLAGAAVTLNRHEWRAETATPESAEPTRITATEPEPEGGFGCEGADAHYFPAPEELGIDAEAVGWRYGHCACGERYDGRYDHEDY